MPEFDSRDSQPLLRPNETVWRRDNARRVALLLDGADYFAALRSALRQARRSVIFVGWDIDSRTRLRGSEPCPRDDAPEGFREFLECLVERRHDLTIRLLLWDYSILYALEREPLPSLNLDWRTPPRISVALDDALPSGASHHQKLVIIDDNLAFCGGLDVTVNRWDTPEHSPFDARRVSPSGDPYGPFHDAQMAVDGAAAAALSELARYRWRRATGEELKPVHGAACIWPDEVQPDFECIEVGIARTLPGDDDQPAITEILNLYEESIRRARRYIYIENQYLTVPTLADAMVAALEESPELEAVIVTPRCPQGWLETKTMGVGQARFMARLDSHRSAGRVRFCYPHVAEDGKEADVMVHAKLMIVDDLLIRVGSANLNNRSMGLDTECDLAIEAGDGAERQRVRKLLCRLLAHHTGQPEDKVFRELASRDSIIETADVLSSASRGLRSLEPATDYDDIVSDTLNVLADREEPLAPDKFVGDMFAAVSWHGSQRRAIRLILVALALIGLVVAWNFTPLAEWADAEKIASLLDSVRGGLWTAPLLLVAYLVGGIVLFPLTVLITLTGMLLGPWSGFLCAMAGALASAALGYGLGRIAGGKMIRRILGKRYRTVRRAVDRSGLFTVTAVRIVPVAPYTVVNVALGAIGIAFWPYLIGTFLGLLPGVLILTVLGDRLLQAWSHPDLVNTGWFLLALATWVALALGLQRLGASLKKD